MMIEVIKKHKNLLENIAIILLIITFFVMSFFIEPKRTIETRKKDYKVMVQNNQGEYVEQTNIPTDGYVLNKTLSSCINGGTLEQNVSDKSIAAILRTYDRCTLYFDKTRGTNSNVSTFSVEDNNVLNIFDVYNESDKSSNVILEYDSNDNSCTNTYAWDQTKDNNLRYVGSNPCNYVKFNDETWRIIGLFGGEEKTIKLIRNKPIGEYSYYVGLNQEESTQEQINSNWLTSNIQSELNGDYLNFNLTQDTLWKTGLNEERVFDHDLVLKEDSQRLILDANFNISEVDLTDETILKTALWYYDNERLDPAKVWNGKVGLVYPSDFGYSVGGTNEIRNECLSNALNNWHERKNCTENIWIKSDGTYTMTNSLNQNLLISKYADKYYINSSTLDDSKEIYPVIFLKPGSIIESGTGEEGDPYIFNIN